MVGLQTLDLAIGVRVPASQPIIIQSDRYLRRRQVQAALASQPAFLLGGC